MVHDLKQLLSAFEKEHQKIKKAKGIFQIDELEQSIDSLFKEYNLTVEQMTIMCDYGEQAEMLDKIFHYNCETFVKPYIGRIALGGFSLSAAVGATAGYAFVLTKAYLTGDTDYDPVAIGALAGIAAELKFTWSIESILKRIPNAKKKIDSYIQEKEKLVDYTISKLKKY